MAEKVTIPAELREKLAGATATPFRSATRRATSSATTCPPNTWTSSAAIFARCTSTGRTKGLPN